MPATATSAAEGPVLFLGTTDLAVGENRFAFAILDRSAEVTEPVADVRFFRLKGETAYLAGEATATYRQAQAKTPHIHAGGTVHLHEEVRGVYIVDKVAFDEPGLWGVQAQVTPAQGGETIAAALAFQVKEKSATPALGSLAPIVDSPTAADVADLSEICSRTPPDEMHRLSLKGARASGRPFVVVFASPAFCASRVCGPVLEVAVAVSSWFERTIDFLHVEPYNLALAHTSGTLQLTDVAVAWGLPSEPWVFVVDKEGRIAAKFEGIVTEQEMKSALEALIGS
ncbi:MAG: hypothetical protein HY685_05675 [Chloroflexi bacterium]|nr:hypothetical protein [Chloroflexota bacterium]